MKPAWLGVLGGRRPEWHSQERVLARGAWPDSPSQLPPQPLGRAVLQSLCLQELSFQHPLLLGLLLSWFQGVVALVLSSQPSYGLVKGWSYGLVPWPW